MNRKLRNLTFLLAFILLSSCGHSKLNSTVSTKQTNVDSTVSISPYFSPHGGCTSAVVSEVNHAKKYVDVAIYSFTSKPIAKALIRAFQRGVKVRVIIDEGTSRSRYCVGPKLASAGIPVRYKKGSGGGLMHNKVAVIDGKVLLTGSFNWTSSAERRNDENLLVIKGVPQVVKAYRERFEKLWELAGLTN